MAFDSATRPILVTGGAGFIGSAVVRHLLAETSHPVLTVDNLSYAGNLVTLGEALENPRHQFVQQDICDGAAMRGLFATHNPAAVMHLAAESHVDRSIDGPMNFVMTNVVGTVQLLEAARQHLATHPDPDFRFLHVSTDEVFGSLGDEGTFDEDTRYDPSSPYSASKAGSDHMARAWQRTFKLPVLVTNCSNNYGPYQYPEKLIPVVIAKCLKEEAIPIYGKGANVRDWLFVRDHAAALVRVLEQGRPGETYNIGGNSERRNIDIAGLICALLDDARPRRNGKSYKDLIQFVNDRPGHDQRYAIDPTKIRTELGWQPSVTFEEGLRETVDWYLANQDWCAQVTGTDYDGRRLGVG